MYVRTSARQRYKYSSPRIGHGIVHNSVSENCLAGAKRFPGRFPEHHSKVSGYQPLETIFTRGVPDDERERNQCKWRWKRRKCARTSRRGRVPQTGRRLHQVHHEGHASRGLWFFNGLYRAVWAWPVMCLYEQSSSDSFTLSFSSRRCCRYLMSGPCFCSLKGRLNIALLEA